MHDTPASSPTSRPVPPPASLPTRPAWRTPLAVIVAGCLISVLGFGARSSLGLFLEPLTAARGFTREPGLRGRPRAADLGLPASVGAVSLALIGLANIAGSFGAGWVGQRWSKRHGLSAIHALRAVAILALLAAPKTAATVYAFATVMGVLWLSTVPLTTGLIAQVFGVRYMATLFGLVFLRQRRCCSG